MIFKHEFKFVKVQSLISNACGSNLTTPSVLASSALSLTSGVFETFLLLQVIRSQIEEEMLRKYTEKAFPSIYPGVDGYMAICKFIRSKSSQLAQIDISNTWRSSGA